ncbi:rRNA-processing protein bfr2 [Puccinia graminis f. sp. tritici]|uniref:Protein BFR2 n=1 Tax=Puccinia graminis f. sp. tritici TaxID=56615 RepID=A0A5B0PWJ8_PUCGR|nr:rRNA-processing protein bfr2 [Puccinia graminis f. sp. tritici]
MSTLASLFKKISQPNPEEIDPEDGYHSMDARLKRSGEEDEEGDDEENEKRIGMGASQLRQKINIEQDPNQLKKYAGRLVNVSDWMDPDNGQLESDNNSQQKNDDDDVDELEDDDEDDENVGLENDQEEDEEEEEDSSRASSTSSNNDPDEEEEAPRSQHPSNPEPDANQSKQTQTHDQPSDLIKHLQSSVKADIEKGKAVKKQLNTYDRLLAIRIGIQKPLIATNKLIEIHSQSEKQDPKEDESQPAKEEVRMALNNLLGISAQIGTLRAELMESIDGEPPRKRRKELHETDVDISKGLKESLEEADRLDKRLSPYLRTTVRKWSTKINSTTTMSKRKFSGGSTKQEENVMDQIEQLWAFKEEREKLVIRSRTSKQVSNRTGLAPQSRNNGCSEDPFLGPQIFEDRDFYLSLLKDVVQTATRNQEETMMGGMNDYRSQRTHREAVDPKASKGRKIRYDVHEKLVSLMVPIQNELWTDPQKDELFGSLFGFGFETNTAPGLDQDQFSLDKSDGFKLL